MNENDGSPRFPGSQDGMMMVYQCLNINGHYGSQDDGLSMAISMVINGYQWQYHV